MVRTPGKADGRWDGAPCGEAAATGRRMRGGSAVVAGGGPAADHQGSGTGEQERAGGGAHGRGRTVGRGGSRLFACLDTTARSLPLPSEPLAPRSRPGDLVASGDRSTRVSLSVLGEGFGPLSAKAEVAGRQIALAATTATAV